MVEYLTGQLDLIRSLDWETCPGEAKCSDDGIIASRLKRNPALSIEQICGKCDFLPTKPGQEPPHLTAAIQRANELAEIRSVCGRPDAFGPLSASEWECIASWVEANNKSEGHAIKARRQEAAHRAQAAEADQRRRS